MLFNFVGKALYMIIHLFMNNIVVQMYDAVLKKCMTKLIVGLVAIYVPDSKLSSTVFYIKFSYTNIKFKMDILLLRKHSGPSFSNFGVHFSRYFLDPLI